LSTKVLRRILQDVGILNWRSKRRPNLTADYARLRLQFASQWINSDWSSTLFSDECSVKKGVGKERTWSFGYPREKWHYNKVDEYPKSKQGSVMIWAAIGGASTAGRRSELIIMEHNPQSKRYSYTTISYLKTFEAGLLPIYDRELYMQDNAPIHKSRVSLQWFNDNSVSLLTGWPPYSPDLNPIEHYWLRFKSSFIILILS
jgi:hypothetical protein